MRFIVLTIYNHIICIYNLYPKKKKNGMIYGVQMPYVLCKFCEERSFHAKKSMLMSAQLQCKMKLMDDVSRLSASIKAKRTLISLVSHCKRYDTTNRISNAK